MWRIIAAALLAAWLPSGCAAAGKTQAEPTAAAAEAAFCWPLAEFRYSLNKPTGAWLAPRGRHSHHLGVDMFAPIGRPVRAIADGVVHDISASGWGAGNVAIMIRHRLADGRWFIALYGHIRNTYGLRKGNRVQRCGTIGFIGPYRCGSHVHFGVIAPGRQPHAPYGTSKRGDHNNFINPVRFLQSGQPEAPGKDEEPPLPPVDGAAAVSPQCAGVNLAEGSPEEDEEDDLLDGPVSPPSLAEPLRKDTAVKPAQTEQKKSRRHAAKADKKERAAKKKAGKNKVKVLQASKGGAKRAVSAPAPKKQAGKRQSAAAKAQKTKQKSRKPAAGRKAARRR